MLVPGGVAAKADPTHQIQRFRATYFRLAWVALASASALSATVAHSNHQDASILRRSGFVSSRHGGQFRKRPALAAGDQPALQLQPAGL